MRLISSIERLEVAAAAARARRSAAVGLVWSNRETKIDPECLEDGEYIAVDIVLEGCAWRSLPDGELPDACSNPPCYWTVHERATRNAEDLGLVRDGAGEKVGRVVEIDGAVLRVEWDTSGERAPASA